MSNTITKLAGAGIVCVSLIGASLSTTTTAKAGSHNLLGALIFGAVAGGVVSGAISRCHGHGAGYRHCHGHHGGHNHYSSGVVYVQPAPPPPTLLPPVVVAPPPVVVAPPVYSGGLPAQHYQWCQRKYRSYRIASNTFQPYQGGRRPCRSPWW